MHGKGMVRQDSDKPPNGNHPSRLTVREVSDIALVVVGLALIASAFSNIPVKVTGLINLSLSAPGALLAQVVFGVVGFTLLLSGMGGLFHPARYATVAAQWWSQVRAPRPRAQPAANVGVAPPRNPLFRGRDTELAELARRLTVEHRVDLSGLGGIGKSSLAIEYLHHCRYDYPEGVFWVRGQTEATLTSDFADLAWLPELNLPERDNHDLGQLIVSVTRWLSSRHRWLLVVDDLDPDQIATLDRLLAHRMQGHVLATCRTPVWSHPLEIGPLTPLAASDYLLERTGQSDRDAASAVAELLEHLPLALEQAAAYIHDTGRSLAAYADLARTRLSDLLREGRLRDYPFSVATTWSISFGRIEQEAPAAAAVLRICAYLESDGIPLDLLRSAAQHLSGDLASTLADVVGLDRAIMPLRRYAMVERRGEILRLHRLVQAVVRDMPTRRDWANVALRTLRATFPTDVTEPRTWPQCAQLLPHVLALLDEAPLAGQMETSAASWLLDQAGGYLQARGEFGPARPLLERALAIRERAMGAEHVGTAASLDHVAGLFRAQGELAAARPLYERALKIRERALGSDHPATAASLNHLAGLFRAQGDLAAARPLYERAVTICERALGPDHPDTATSLNHLAGLLWAQGELAAARPIYERALAIRERSLGFDHPSTAASLDHIAGLLRAQGDLPAARPLHERALAIREKALGTHHPSTAASLNNLARLLRDQGELVAARPLYERALMIREKVLGPEHPSTAGSLNNLARLLRDQGELEAARSLYERALAIRVKALGPDHPSIAATLNNLAQLLRAQGELSAARRAYERALAIRENVLGPEHPSTAASLNNLARLLRAQGEMVAARPLLERALAIREEVLGPEHPATARSLNNLAGLLRAQGDLEAARPLVERALAIREKALGPEHPATARSLNTLARVLREQDELTAARPLLERALAIREKALGPEHPATAISLNTLARLHRALGGREGREAAQPLYERALAIREKALGPDHPSTASSLHKLARLLRGQGDVATSQSLYERALAIREKVLGPDHPSTAATLHGLARLLEEWDDESAARPLFERALAIRERALGPDHPATERTRDALDDLDDI